MSDWAKDAGERRRAKLEEDARHAQDAQDQRKRNAPVYERLVDETVRGIVDHALQRMRSYADASGENLQSGRQPSGGMWVEKPAHPSGRLEIKLDRNHGVLSSETVFSQKDGQRPYAGPKHQANFLVSDDGERLLLQIVSATPREGIDVVDDWLREFVERISR